MREVPCHNTTVSRGLSQRRSDSTVVRIAPPSPHEGHGEWSVRRRWTLFRGRPLRPSPTKKRLNFPSPLTRQKSPGVYSVPGTGSGRPTPEDSSPGTQADRPEGTEGPGQSRDAEDGPRHRWSLRQWNRTPTQKYLCLQKTRPSSTPHSQDRGTPSTPRDGDGVRQGRRQ